MYNNNGDLIALKQYGCTYLAPSYDSRRHLGATPYCGCQALVDNTLYCQEHYDVVYHKNTANRKRHKDVRKKRTLEDLVQDIIDIAEELELEGWEPGKEALEL
jgi:hypothetical protein